MEQTNEPIRHRRRSGDGPKKPRLRDTLACGLLLGTAFLVLLISILLPDREFSETENRMLSQTPEFSLSALADGSYLEDLGNALTDQFPGRDLWIRLDLWRRQAMGQQESSGVYLCADGSLIQAPGEPNLEELERNLAAVRNFSAAYPYLRMTMAVVPNAAAIHADRLPANAPVRDQRADLQDLKERVTGPVFADVTEALEQHSGEYLYYRTDHHWTSLGACHAFTAMAPALGISAPAADSYTVYPVSTTFEGTLASRSGSHGVYDQVDIYVPKTDVDYSVTYVDAQRRVASLYDRSALERKDHYTVFFGGNYGRVDITTTAQTGRCLLLLKDSYANSFVQFLYPHYDRILMIDPRYYYGELKNLVNSQGVTDVLYLYNLDTFLADSSLADVLGS